MMHILIWSDIYNLQKKTIFLVDQLQKSNKRIHAESDNTESLTNEMYILVAFLFSFAGHSWGCNQKEEFTKDRRDYIFYNFLSTPFDNTTDPLKQNRDPLYNWEQAIVAFPAKIAVS